MGRESDLGAATKGRRLRATKMEMEMRGVGRRISTGEDEGLKTVREETVEEMGRRERKRQVQRINTGGPTVRTHALIFFRCLELVRNYVTPPSRPVCLREKLRMFPVSAGESVI